VGNSWEAIRQRNMLPDPESVRPDETEKVNVPDEWDSAGSAPKGDKPAGDSDGSKPSGATSDEDM
jgi:hypothetical protein